MAPCRFFLLRGEIDVSNADGLLTTLRSTAGQHSTATLLVDCTDLEFIDAAGIHVLVAMQRELATQGRELRIIHPSPILGRILRALDFEWLLSPVPVSNGATSPRFERAAPR